MNVDGHAFLQVHHEVEVASRVVAPMWPLSSTIANNPLAGLETEPFPAALVRAGSLMGARGHLTLEEMRAAHRQGHISDATLRAALHRAVSHEPSDEPRDLSPRVEQILLADLLHGPEVAPACRTVLTTAEQADAELGTAWQAEVDLEASEHCLRLAAGASPRVRSEAEAAARLVTAMEQLGVAEPDRVTFLEAHVTALPGWSSHLRWRDAQLGETSLLDYLAVRVEAEARRVGGRRWVAPERTPRQTAMAARVRAVAAHLGAGPDQHDELRDALARLDDTQRAIVWLDAYERSRHDPLLAGLAGTAQPVQPPPTELAAHVVCCIDVRSEGLRRHLEATGPYETYGYAGFFGLPLRFEPLSGGTGTDQLPVLLRPDATVTEVPDPGHEEAAVHAVEHRRRDAARDAAWRAAKYHPIAPLALAEAAGWPAGALAAARTAAPGLVAWAADRTAPPTAPTHHDRTHLSIEDQAAWVAAIWRLGLGERTAPLVVLCGHTSVSDNNPSESALACGACGGNPGGANARLAAAMANDPAVRARLAELGIQVPPATWFVAAEHDTSTDVVILLDTEKVPTTHRAALDRLAGDLARAGESAALERAQTLPGCDPSRRRTARLRAVRQRGRDWAEPVPELGLAGNLAFVVGPRHLTRHLDLGRRVFLHSYDAAADLDGATLTGILTAPLVVAQWINAQYYFSTTDPEIFGSGSKALHNPVGDVGVLSGPGGDLRRGLALQSVRAGDRLLHEPVRLLAVVEGRLEHVDAAIAGSDTLRQLVEHGWIHLVARQHPGQPWQQRGADGWTVRRTAGTIDGGPLAPHHDVCVLTSPSTTNGVDPR